MVPELCSVCASDVRAPRVLPCQHTFCDPCVKSLAHRACPTCRMPFERSAAASRISSSNNLADLCKAEEMAVCAAASLPTSPQPMHVEIMCGACDRPSKPATHRCVECCEVYCAEHNKIVHRIKINAKHSVHALPPPAPVNFPFNGMVRGGSHGSLPACPTPRARVCMEHPNLTANQLNIFCDTCQRMMCSHCAAHDHRTHVFTHASTAVAKQAERLRASVDAARTHMDKLHSTLTAVDDARARLGAAREAAERRVREDDAVLRQAVEVRTATLLRTAADIAEGQDRQLAGQRAALQATLDGLQRVSKMGQRALGMADAGDAVGLAAQVTARLGALLNTPLSWTVAACGELGVECDTRGAVGVITACGRVWDGRPCAVHPVALDTIAAHTATVAWTACDPPSDKYEVEVMPAVGGQGLSVHVSSTSHTFAGLQPNTAYTARVRAVRGDRPGAWSAPTAFHTAAAARTSVSQPTMQPMVVDEGSPSVARSPAVEGAGPGPAPTRVTGKRASARSVSESTTDSEQSLQSLCWDAETTDSRHIVMKADGRHVSMHRGPDDGGWRNVKSAEATDDFTVRLGSRPKAPYPGYVFIGFAREEKFAHKTDISQHDDVYTLWPEYGTLVGSKKDGAPYCMGLTSGTVRCVRDGDAGTISFHVDGVDRGVAWRNVPSGPLHAVVLFVEPGIEAELLPQ